MTVRARIITSATGRFPVGRGCAATRAREPLDRERAAAKNPAGRSLGGAIHRGHWRSDSANLSELTVLPASRRCQTRDCRCGDLSVLPGENDGFSNPPDVTDRPGTSHLRLSRSACPGRQLVELRRWRAAVLAAALPTHLAPAHIIGEDVGDVRFLAELCSSAASFLSICLSSRAQVSLFLLCDARNGASGSVPDKEIAKSQVTV